MEDDDEDVPARKKSEYILSYRHKSDFNELLNRAIAQGLLEKQASWFDRNESAERRYYMLVFCRRPYFAVVHQAERSSRRMENSYYLLRKLKGWKVQVIELDRNLVWKVKTHANNAEDVFKVLTGQMTYTYLETKYNAARAIKLINRS